MDRSLNSNHGISISISLASFYEVFSAIKGPLHEAPGLWCKRTMLSTHLVLSYNPRISTPVTDLLLFLSLGLDRRLKG